MRRPTPSELASVSIMLTCGVMIWSTLRSSVPPPPAGGETYAVGETFGPVAAYDFSAAPKTLVLFVRSGCRFCTESMTFYRQLCESAGRIQIIAVGHESEQVLRDYLARHEVQVDGVYSVPHGSLKLSRTPALVLVAASRKVERLWRGKLQTAALEREVVLATRLGGDPLERR